MPKSFWIDVKLNTDFLITSYIFSYLLISPRNPVNQGFVDISLLVDTSRIFLYLYYREHFKRSKKVVNSYSANRSISACIPSMVTCAYRLSVISILLCPMMYCRLFGFMFFPANLVQKVCLNTCGEKYGSSSSCVLLYFVTRFRKVAE